MAGVPVVKDRTTADAGGSAALDAFAAALMIGNGALWPFLAAVALRAPHRGLVWLMGPVLCTLGSLGETDRDRRMRALFLDLALMGILQFLFAVLRNVPALLVAAIPLAVLVTGKRSSGNSAGAALCASFLDLNSSDVESAAGMLALSLVLAIVLPLSDRLLDVLLFGRHEWRGIGKKPPLDHEALFRRMAVLSAAAMLMFALDWQYGHWIPFAAALSYSGGDTAAALRGNWRARLGGALAGLMIAILWMGTACYMDYRFSYVSATLLPLAFYYSVRTKDRTGFCIMYMMICGTLVDPLRGASPSYGNGWQLFFQTTAGIMLGAGIVALVEYGAACAFAPYCARKP